MFDKVLFIKPSGPFTMAEINDNLLPAARALKILIWSLWIKGGMVFRMDPGRGLTHGEMSRTSSPYWNQLSDEAGGKVRELFSILRGRISELNAQVLKACEAKDPSILDNSVFQQQASFYVTSHSSLQISSRISTKIMSGEFKEALFLMEFADSKLRPNEINRLRGQLLNFIGKPELQIAFDEYGEFFNEISLWLKMVSDGLEARAKTGRDSFLESFASLRGSDERGFNLALRGNLPNLEVVQDLQTKKNTYRETGKIAKPGGQ